MRGIQLVMLVMSIMMVVLGVDVAVGADIKQDIKQNAQPLQRIQDVIEDGKAYILANKDTVSEAELSFKLREIVAPTFDFREMAKRCLGKNWSDGTDTQQREFIDLFSEMLADSYMKKIVKGIDTAEIKYPSDAVEMEGNKATVKMMISSGGETASVHYRLLQRTDSSWWVYDVVIENIGLVSNYRTEFSDIIRRNGFDGLIKMLKERIEKMKKENEKTS